MAIARNDGAIGDRKSLSRAGTLTQRLANDRVARLTGARTNLCVLLLLRYGGEIAAEMASSVVSSIALVVRYSDQAGILPRT